MPEDEKMTPFAPSKFHVWWPAMMEAKQGPASRLTGPLAGAACCIVDSAGSNFKLD